MVIAIDPHKVHDYVLKSERALPKEQQTVFKLRCLTVSQRAEVDDNYTSLDGRLLTGTRQLTTLRLGLAGWENMLDEAGNKIPFNEKEAAASIAFLPHRVMGELVDAIFLLPGGMED